ncbi:DUF5993 family protein [Pandoraea oxalativorans]|uniref:DUF5993 family protein n=1 Tax=Pandoraea oxalativorans TaxID=573737 RepID=UPI00069872C4|nr:DUF5993 family protein [Pandoraea oxalativorans]
MRNAIDDGLRSGYSKMMALPFLIFFVSVVAILRDRNVVALYAGGLAIASTLVLFFCHATSALGLNF